MRGNEAEWEATAIADKPTPKYAGKGEGSRKAVCDRDDKRLWLPLRQSFKEAILGLPHLVSPAAVL